MNVPQKKSQKRLMVLYAAIAGIVLAGMLTTSQATLALDGDVSDGITVDSTLDTPDALVGNGICDDGSGNCTLRAAIQEANNNADATSISFTIAGSGLHTLTPSTPYPSITTQVSIDGYTQPGSIANSAVSPEPLNGTLTIEIDGTGIARSENLLDGSCFSVVDANNVELKGLIINNCGNNGIHVERSNFLAVQGNYIGTDPTGMLDEGNGRGYTAASIGNGIYMNASNNALIGGALPEERNIISGNQAGEIFWGNEYNAVNPSEYNIVQGNYIGVGSDGQEPLPSGYAWGLGNAILFGNSHNDTIGGDATGEGNVIGSSAEYGVAFRDRSSGTIIQGNFIGTDYTGTQAMDHVYGSGNAGAGIHVGAVSQLYPDAPAHSVLIGGPTAGARNIISGNLHTGSSDIAGVSINDGAYNVTVQNNYIGTDITGTVAIPNDFGVYMNTETGIPSTYNNLIGGTGADEGNLIAGNNNDGIALLGSGAANNAILGNSITQNGDLGIDLGNNGSTSNDANDTDDGPNSYLNNPEFTSTSEDGGNTLVGYTLDVPTGSYRIEFFSNPNSLSGIAEGTTYLGSQNVTSTGSGAQAFSTSLSGVNHTKITAVATKIDGSLPSGYGNSSEFNTTASSSNLSVTKTLDNPEDLAIDATLNYTITVTNNGPIAVDLSEFDGTNLNPFVSNLFIDILPHELTYSAAGGSDVACTSYGENSAGLAPFFANHADHELVACAYTGSQPALNAGESIETTLSVLVDDESDLVFTNYVLGGLAETDLDTGTVLEGFGETDLVDFLVANNVNNLASAVTSPVQSPAPTPSAPTILPRVGAALITLFMFVAASTAAGLILRVRRGSQLTK
jgi:CSLREA domain-containing protein